MVIFLCRKKRKELLMNRVLVTTIILMALILPILPANAETQMQKTNRMMVDCIQNSLVYKADAQNQTVWVNEQAWRSAYFDDKKNIANFFLIYTQTRNQDAAFVDIRSAYSNKVLGKIDLFGYKEK